MSKSKGPSDFRSSVTGRFVKESYADRHPNTTQEEHNRPAPPPPPKKK